MPASPPPPPQPQPQPPRLQLPSDTALTRQQKTNISSHISRPYPAHECPPGASPTLGSSPVNSGIDNGHDNLGGDRNLLISTGSAARWRRREGSLSKSLATDRSAADTTTTDTHRPAHQRFASANNVGTNIKDWNWLQRASHKDLVLRVAVMEEVHGVDVSWLHRPKSNTEQRKPVAVPPPPPPSKKNPSSSDAKPSSTTNGDGPRAPKPSNLPLSPEAKSLPSLPAVTSPSPPTQDAITTLPSTSPQTPAKAVPKRPGLLGRTSSERLTDDGKGGSRRSSWMTSISSKFSASPGQPGRPAAATTPPQPLSKSPNATTSPMANGIHPNAGEQSEPYTPAKPKDSPSSNFFSSLTRRLSTASQSGAGSKVHGTGGMCPRRVLNVDPNRERCLVPEMDPSKLRRVSFCVDVEIVGGPKGVDDEDEEDRTRRRKEFKMKERAEGEALKHPEAIKEEKEEAGEPKLEKEAKNNAPAPPTKGADAIKEPDSMPRGSLDEEAAARKKEKKKKSEDERKERKEKRRRRAEENGSIPVEMSIDAAEDAPIAADTTSSADKPAPSSLPPPFAASRPTRQDRPTVDPARIYRRCCQLRESPILKRITEQLMNPKCMLPQEPGIVNCLDLTGSRLQLADFATLGDWLAVVPVKQLRLEDADLSDEGVRCVLAGLLSAKRPQPSARKSATPKHRDALPPSSRANGHRERAGVVEKLTLKNNPRISRVAWKHISLFIYLCRSLKSIDLSMNQFPAQIPVSAEHVTPTQAPANGASKVEGLDAADALYKCLSERPGGARLEELIVSECGLSAPQIRKIVDGVIVAGISRLGLAGNSIDDEGLQHVIHYLHSGICQGLDLGSNDLRGKLDVLAIAIALKPDSPCWGLSLANCNLDSASLKQLFAALQKLPNFRFIDLGHNHDLCKDTGLVTLLRRYIGSMKYLKRIHLNDVGMSPKQAIALADVLPEGPALAHLNLLENSQLTALARAKTETDQGEACALYASLMAAVRVSKTLICIDVDVPARDNSEVVKALAKQVVAYSLRNMEQFALAEVTGGSPSQQVDTANATAALTRPHGGEAGFKEVQVPDILMHLVGHIKYTSQNSDTDPPAPDEDYIVGGTGVVKALQYLIGEKANDLRRTSVPQSPTVSASGTASPRGDRPDSSAGLDEASKGKAKQMSRDLLDDARKIRARLHPALAKEATSGDELAYRRLLFLDQTLQNIVGRFEEEYPETRVRTDDSGTDTKVAGESPPVQRGLPHILASSTAAAAASASQNGVTEPSANASDDDEELIHPEPALSRRNSNASLRVRSQNAEEGRLHRMGQAMRREMVDSSADSPVGTAASSLPSTTGNSGAATPRDDSTFNSPTHANGNGNVNDVNGDDAGETERIRALGERLENISGVDLRDLVSADGMDAALKLLGANYEDLRLLQEQDPESWKAFVEAHWKSRANADS